MTLQEFEKLCKKNNIPESAEMITDSGWECEGAQVEDVFYDSTNNLLILTQEADNNVGTFNVACYVHIKDMDIRYVNPKRLE